jgi:HlyD family secretion protein
MIKNAPPGRTWAWAAIVVVLVGCRSSPSRPPPYQGVVEYEERVLGFELGGRVERVQVRRGDVVADQQVLAEIDDTLEKLSRSARVDDTEAAQAELALLQAGARREDVGALAAQVRAVAATEGMLRKSAERVRGLHASGAVSQAELDRAEADLDRVTAERKSTEQRLASLQRGARTEEIARARSRVEGTASAIALEDERIARHALRAHGPGEVLDIHVEPGELTGPGSPVVTVADTTRPYVEVFVPQGELDGIRAGAKATVQIDSTKETLSGSVEHVGSRTEFTPRYIFSERERPNLVVRVRVRVVDPERRAHAGVPAFVSIAR